MATLTYNVKLVFTNIDDHTYWSNLLLNSCKAYNKCSEIIVSNKIPLDLKSVHNAVYHILRTNFPIIPSQGIIKIYKECISAYRSMKSNGMDVCKILHKHTMSMRLDKRLYSNLTLKSISLCSAIPCKRAIAELVQYPKLAYLFNRYKTHDPIIFYKNNVFYLSIPFDVPELPINCDTCIGVDMGEQRFAVSSDGIIFNDYAYNARRRRLRYLKRCLQRKGSKSAIKHLHRLSVKEQNQSTDMCHRVANDIISSTTASIIVIEDLSKIKKSTARTVNGFIRKSHNRRISQIPFYKLKRILSYKALLHGKRVETVSPFMTSQTDCTTGKREGIRKNRRFYCKSGTILDSDWNAAVNIARKSKHPFSFKMPLDGTLRTWRAGCMLNSHTYVRPVNI